MRFWKTTILILSYLTHAANGADWSNTSVSLLGGKGFVEPSTPDDKKAYSTLTLEHVSGWAYGDNYFFTDIGKLFQNSSGPSLYTEWAPRVSSAKLLNKENYGEFISDISLAFQVNAAPGVNLAKLGGLSFNFSVPGLQVLSMSAYARSDSSQHAVGQQLTLVWKSNFNCGVDWSFEGFADVISKVGDLAAQVVTQPRLLWIANPALATGLEWHYWKNKYGIEDFNENAPQLMLRWTL